MFFNVFLIDFRTSMTLQPNLITFNSALDACRGAQTSTSPRTA